MKVDFMGKNVTTVVNLLNYLLRVRSVKYFARTFHQVVGLQSSGVYFTVS